MMATHWHRLLVSFLCFTRCQSFLVSTERAFRWTADANSKAGRTATLVKDDEETSLAERKSMPRSLLPPPPKSTGNPSDDVFRTFRATVPLSVQYWMRDSGFLRFVVDSLVYLGLPDLIQQYPDAVHMFLKLSSQCETIQYGDHPMQKMDVLKPEGESKGMVVVCHGGAWGSGKKWMYRLTATKKLERGYTVAVLGYRTYPDATVDGQVSDIRDALTKLKEQYPSQHTTILGHSSGAHISLLGALKQELKVDALICVAGVYDVVKHFDFESGRGVEAISPLKPANGHVEEEWRRRSPTSLIDKTTKVNLPPTLLVHGADDNVVPYTSALEFYDALQHCESDQNCTLSILPSTEHAETVIQLMVGGETQDVVLEWLERQQQT